MEALRSVFVPIFSYSVRSILWLGFCICLGLFIGGSLFGEHLDISPLFAKRAEPERAIAAVPALPKTIKPTMTLASCQQQVNDVMASNEILFSIGKADIKAASHSALDLLSNTLLKCHNFSVSIKGHTDNTGSSQSNIGLSKRRAESVQRYFSRRGVGLSRMKIMGYGSSQPIASNTTSQGRARNRRIEIIFSELQKSYKVEIL